jgi:hypothetical protein
MGERAKRPHASPGPRVAAYVRWTLRHGRLLWAVAAVLFVPAFIRAVLLYAHLKSDIEELLPRNAESVAAIDELRSRMPGLRYLGVIVDTGTPETFPPQNDSSAISLAAFARIRRRS